MLQLILLGALLFAVAIAVFAVQNTTPVAVAFLVWRADAMATSVLVLVAATLGGGLAMLLGGAREIQLRWRLRSQAQQLAAAQQRLAVLETSGTSEAAANAAAPADGGDAVRDQTLVVGASASR
jgi:putative membrane protein